MRSTSRNIICEKQPSGGGRRAVFLCAGMGSFVPPGASSFLSSLKESYQRKPLETTFQDFLGAGMCRCCACGRKLGRFVPRHEYLSFFVKRKVPKKTTQTYGLRIPWRGVGKCKFGGAGFAELERRGTLSVRGTACTSCAAAANSSEGRGWCAGRFWRLSNRAHCGAKHRNG